MRFEYIVLLIIAFNVITAVMQRRAKKARAKAQQEAAARGDSVDPGRRSSSKPYDFEEEDEDEEDQDQGGDYRRGPRMDRDAASTRVSRAERREALEVEPARRAGGGRETMPSLGRDILDQLARDLGLRVPKPTAPPPAEARTASAEDLASARREAAHAARLAERDRERERERERERLNALGSRSHAASRENGPTRMAPVMQAPEMRTTSPRVSLHGVERLREAFVLKEILDAPLSRRRRRAA